MSIKFISPKKSVNSAFLKLPVPVEKLEQTGAKHIVNGEEIKVRKKTSNKWFETQDQIGYYKEFAKPKIVYPEISSLFSFTYDESGLTCNNKNYIITEKECSQSLPKGTETVIASEAKQSNAFLHKALLAIFNSNLVKLWIEYNCPVLNGGARNISKTYFENFRIPLDNSEILQQLATFADEIIAAKKQASCRPERTLEPKTIGKVEGSSEALQKQIADLETQVNTLVYQLYDITDTEEIEAVEKR